MKVSISLLVAVLFAQSAFAFIVHRCRVDYAFDQMPGNYRQGLLAEEFPSAIPVYEDSTGKFDTYIWASVSQDGKSFNAILKGQGVKWNDISADGEFHSKKGFVSGVLSCEKKSESVPVLFRDNFDGNLFLISSQVKDQLYYRPTCYIGDVREAQKALSALINKTEDQFGNIVENVHADGQVIHFEFKAKTCVSTTPPRYYGDSYCGKWQLEQREQFIKPCNPDWSPEVVTAPVPQPVHW